MIIKQILTSARLGLPLAICAGRAGLSRETLCQWRAADAELDRRIEQARMEGAETAWKQIMKAGESGAPGAWQSTAWRLERGFPDAFANPEIQLGVQVNNQATVNNTLVISVETARELERRIEPINREIDELMRTHEAKVRDRTGIGQGPVREVETSLVRAGPIILPPADQRTLGWWKSLSSGSSQRQITIEAARFVLQTLITQILGITRASGVKIEIDDQDPTLAELWSAINEAVGPAGWTWLVKKGEA